VGADKYVVKTLCIASWVLCPRSERYAYTSLAREHDVNVQLLELSHCESTHLFPRHLSLSLNNGVNLQKSSGTFQNLSPHDFVSSVETQLHNIPTHENSPLLQDRGNIDSYLSVAFISCDANRQSACASSFSSAMVQTH
jgi:hypothetical protein